MSFRFIQCCFHISHNLQMTKSSVVFTANTVRNFEITKFFERILAIGVCAIEQGCGRLRAHFSNTVFVFVFLFCLFVCFRVFFSLLLSKVSDDCARNCNFSSFFSFWIRFSNFTSSTLTTKQLFKIFFSQALLRKFAKETR